MREDNLKIYNFYSESVITIYILVYYTRIFKKLD